ncbi:MAG: group III truncated hemoglobin [Phaeodactylibacter sp.]|nr:group III truncated hemoglobin [Phaeodactylibacter sp.]MCB9300147.1 group III truncated hemoglobin [Lewinellaceae bacterium]
MAKQDITTRNDIETLVNTFYDKVKRNPVLGYIFTDVAKVDWVHHLPRMYSFWSSILLGEQSYQGNPMIKHIELSRLTALTDTEFSEWLQLFHETLDELFEGENVAEAKVRADNIARLMLFKIQSVG